MAWGCNRGETAGADTSGLSVPIESSEGPLAKFGIAGILAANWICIFSGLDSGFGDDAIETGSMPSNLVNERSASGA